MHEICSAWWPGSQNEASTDLIGRQPTSVWEGLDVFILFSAVTKKKNQQKPCEGSLRQQLATKKEFEPR